MTTFAVKFCNNKMSKTKNISYFRFPNDTLRCKQWIDTNTSEWRKRHNKELEELFQRPNIANEIKKRRLTWAGHAWRRVGSIVRTTIEENPVGKRPLGRPRLRWEDCVKRDVENIEPEIDGEKFVWRYGLNDRKPKKKKSKQWMEKCNTENLLEKDPAILYKNY